MRTWTVLLALAVLAAWALPASADWDFGDPHKWLQMPDLTATGMDVNATDRNPPGLPPDGRPRILADDFLCTSTARITDIHLWGSWKDDLLPFGADPGAVMFRLAILADVPVGPEPFSHPDGELWSMMFQPGQYGVRLWAEDLEEGWYDPATGEYMPLGDSKCYQYNFDIPWVEAFEQQGTQLLPKVYWLSVDAVVLDPDPMVEFGWKTSVTNWNDDATWRLDNTPWAELRYPIGHPMELQSFDMAFVITPEPTTIALLALAGVGVVGRMIRRRK